MKWNLIAITAQTAESADVYVQMLECRRDLGLLPGVDGSTKLLGVPDPTTDDTGQRQSRSIGSGGATLNAILHIAEYLCATKGIWTMEADVFVPQPRAILILHCRNYFDFPHEGYAMGRCFSPLPVPGPFGHATNVDGVMQLIEQLGGPSLGIWVAGTEFTFCSFLEKAGHAVQPDDFFSNDTRDIRVVTWKADNEWTKHHGSYLLDEQHNVTKINHKAGGDGYLVAPIVKFGSAVAEALLEIHSRSPFDACSYYRADTGSDDDVLNLNLYLDILGACLPLSTLKSELPQHSTLHRVLGGTHLVAKVIQPDFHIAYSRSPEDHAQLLRYLSPPSPSTPINSTVDPFAQVGLGAILIDAEVKAGDTVAAGEVRVGCPRGAVRDIFYCSLRARMRCARGVVASHLQRQDNTCVQTYLNEFVVICKVFGSSEFHNLCAWFDTQLSALPFRLLGRGLCVMSDLLATYAGSLGGLRSGPCRHKDWKEAFQSLLQGDSAISISVSLLAKVRERWLDGPTMIMRAARHYEGAAQVVTQQCVESASTFITVSDRFIISPTPVGVWVQVALAARIDIAGGWSDTPPVSYEFGGRVVNVAILVDNERPLRCRARRISENVLRLTVDGGLTSECRTYGDVLKEYHVPAAPCALLKAAFVCLNLIPFDADPLRPIDFGMEVVAESALPMGSGLGGSSILGGAIVMAVARAAGLGYDADAHVHLVLKLEQLLTTGGGWQDQVGALYRGIKRCESLPQLPLQVKTEVLPVPPAFLRTLSDHFMLIYTGRARLARNLLQSVLRRWGARLPSVVNTVHGLTSNAVEMERALLAGDILAVGKCLSTYWAQKVDMAGAGAHPLVMTSVLSAVQDDICGAALAGAGGGGFMILLTKEPKVQGKVWEKIARDVVPMHHHMSMHNVSIDEEGPQMILVEP